MNGWVAKRFENGGAADMLMENGTHYVLFREPDSYTFKVRAAFNQKVIATFTDEMLVGMSEADVRALVAIAVRAHEHDWVPDNTSVITRLVEICKERVA